MSSPVFGLRPGRSLFSRKSKLPKPDNFTCSPLSRACLISSKNTSTVSLASRLLNPTFSNKQKINYRFISIMNFQLLLKHITIAVNLTDFLHKIDIYIYFQ
jgi:hypothetical protein